MDNSSDAINSGCVRVFEEVPPGLHLEVEHQYDGARQEPLPAPSAVFNSQVSRVRGIG